MIFSTGSAITGDGDTFFWDETNRTLKLMGGPGTSDPGSMLRVLSNGHDPSNLTSGYGLNIYWDSHDQMRIDSADWGADPDPSVNARDLRINGRAVQLRGIDNVNFETAGKIYMMAGGGSPPGGAVGIGTTSPQAGLEIASFASEVTDFPTLLLLHADTGEQGGIAFTRNDLSGGSYTASVSCYNGGSMDSTPGGGLICTSGDGGDPDTFETYNFFWGDKNAFHLADVDMDANSRLIHNLTDPVDPQDAATKASSEAYAPGAPGNWAGTPPATVKEALDRIAAVVSVGGGTPIP